MSTAEVGGQGIAAVTVEGERQYDPVGASDVGAQASPGSSTDQEARRRVLHRLRRAQGQLAAVVEAVDEGKPCRDVVTQLAAVSKALDRAGVVLISNAMQECLADAEAPDRADKLTLDEVEKLFLMLA